MSGSRESLYLPSSPQADYRFMHRRHREPSWGLPRFGDRPLSCAPAQHRPCSTDRTVGTSAPSSWSPGQGDGSQACPSQPWADYLGSLRRPVLHHLHAALKHLRPVFLL